jgi:hypothetical protein
MQHRILALILFSSCTDLFLFSVFKVSILRIEVLFKFFFFTAALACEEKGSQASPKLM